MNKKTIYIKGMHCVACELLIADELQNITEINSVIVRRKKETADIFYQGVEPDFKLIKNKLKDLGYDSSLNPSEKMTNFRKAALKNWLISIAIAVILYLLYKLFNNLGVLNWLDIDTSNITYAVAFLIGVVASLSTCLAIVGAVVISFSAKYQARGGFFQSSVKPHLLFQLGRLAAFTVLGGLLGYIGGWISFTPFFIGWFTVFVAAVLAWLGLNILGITPSLSAVGIRMPKSSMKVWQKLKNSDHAAAPVVLGGLTFFLPCGFTQSMQLFAMASGSLATGAATMFLFALGTMPVLMGLGVATTRFKNTKTVIFQQVVGLIVVLFSVYTLASGLALAGISSGLFASGNAQEAAKENNVQIINMTVDYAGFHPNVFKLKKGAPVEWRIKGEQVSGCTNEIIIHSLDIKQKINIGDNIIKFTPTKAGTVGFSCWMGMVRGKFVVEDLEI